MNAAVVIATYNERDNLGGLVSAILNDPNGGFAARAALTMIDLKLKLGGEL